MKYSLCISKINLKDKYYDLEFLCKIRIITLILDISTFERATLG